MKYIDADKLKIKVDSFMDNLWKVLPDCSNVESGELSIREASNLGAYKALESVMYMIDSLQKEQPEVDLEEEIVKYFQGCWPGMKTPEACNHHLVFTPPAIMKMAKHFYELGLNARKEE